VTSAIGTTPIACELHYDVGAGDVTVPLVRSGALDEWIGEIPPQPFATAIAYHLFATDSAGYTERLPAKGEFPFLVGAHAVFYADDFESGVGGWTTSGTQNDWQLGSPAGKSTDPAAAHSGASCWGNDLGPSGFDGAYRANANTWLYSPVIDASGRTHTHLRYARWLGVEDAVYDQAEVRVAGTTLWTNPAGSGSDHLIDTDWVIHDVDTSAVADNDPAFHLRFNLKSDGGLQFGGWNVDDVEMYALEQGVEPELWRDVGVISLASGGTTTFELNLGASRGGRAYVLLAGISGTSPGFDWARRTST
jgi:hypothetical protein